MVRTLSATAEDVFAKRNAAGVQIRRFLGQLANLASPKRRVELLSPHHSTADGAVGPARVTPPPATTHDRARNDHLSSEAQAGLMARLSHDLRTPLNVMLGFAELMKAETFGPLGDHRYRDYVAHMQSSGQELLEATEATLLLASLLVRADQASHATASLSALLADAWTAAARSHTMQTRALAIYIPAGATVRGDIPAIRQCLINLLRAASAKAHATSPIDFTASLSFGRVSASISVEGDPGRRLPATTGCHAPTSTWPSVEDLPISISRTLLGLQGIPLIEQTYQNGRWSVSISLEEGVQSDLFAPLAPRMPETVRGRQHL
jgi:signal transduction histidine kinase